MGLRAKRAEAFRDRHILITGGTSGIGRTLALQANRYRARVSVLAFHDHLISRLQALAPDIHVIGVDVRDGFALDEAISESMLVNGPVDTLVTSAGIVHPAAFPDLSDDHFIDHLNVNYLGTLRAIRSVIPGMLERRSGSIVMMSSLAAQLGVFGYGAYGPSKYAVRGLFETLRVELAPHNIDVLCVFPPDVYTSMLAYEELHRPDELKAMGGPAAVEPEDVVDAIVKGLTARRSRIFIGFESRFIAKVSALAPRLVDAVVDRDIRRSRKARG